MFDFWKEVIINSNDRLETVKNAAGEELVRVKRCADYNPKNVVDGIVYKTLPVEGSAAKINLATVAAGHTDSRLTIALGLVEGHADSEFARPWAAFKNSVAVEFKNLESLKAALRLAVGAHIASVVGDEWVLVDPRVVVKEIFVADRNGADFGADVDMKAAVTANVVPVGTGAWILENLRFPTHVNTYVGAPNADEMPIANGKYVQYAFEYCVSKRGFHGQGAVGAPMASVTHHVFYVLEGVDASILEGLAAKGGLITIPENKSYSTVRYEEVTGGEAAKTEPAVSPVEAAKEVAKEE